MLNIYVTRCANDVLLITLSLRCAWTLFSLAHAQHLRTLQYATIQTVIKLVEVIFDWPSPDNLWYWQLLRVNTGRGNLVHHILIQFWLSSALFALRYTCLAVDIESYRVL